MKELTFDQALSRIPNHVVYSFGEHSKTVLTFEVPLAVREKQAVRLMYNTHAGVSSRDNGWLYLLYPAIDSEEGGIVVAAYKYVRTEDNYGIRKFISKEKFVEFHKMIPPHLSDIDLMDDCNPFETWLNEMTSKEMENETRS